MEKEILQILKELKSDMTSVKSDMTSMKSDITSMKSALNEHSEILRALEHKTDVISAEQENLKHTVAEVMGEVKSIRKDLSNLELITANNWSDIVKLKAVK